MNKANVIIITVDECKASAMSPYGNTSVDTPAAELASRQGATFENAFTCHPKCVPSRCCLFSGRYAHTDGHRTLPGFELRKEEENIASILKREGYTTAMFGKNHTIEESYVNEVFDEYTEDYRLWVMDSTKEISFLKDSEMPMDDPLFRSFYKGRWDDHFDDKPADLYYIEDGIRFIKKNKNRPFFLHVDLFFPHPDYFEMEPYIKIIRERGITLPPKHSLEAAPDTLKAFRKAYDLEELRDEDWEKVVAAYYSMVSYVDNGVKKIYECVDECGLKDNTIIIYTADHGDFAGEHGCAEKYDTLFYECIVKIPLFIQYPPAIPAGIKLSSLVENVDIVPTILDLLGLEVPAFMHGKSLVPYLSGVVDIHKEIVFCEGGVEDYATKLAPHYDSPECEYMHNVYYWKQVALVDYPLSMQRSKMARTREWKLIYRQNGEKELYNLLEDPNEFNNRAKDPACAEIIITLMEELIKWMIRTEPDSPRITTMFA